MPYLTPPSLPSDDCCFVLRFPDVAEFRHAFAGALLELAQAFNWEQFGAVTPDEAAAAAFVSFQQYLVSDCMIGSVSFYAGTLPDNVLVCDGTQYARVDYPTLYARLDAQFIVDADNFTVPDLIGLFALGGDEMTLGDTGGETEHTLTVSEMPSHTHIDSGHAHSEITAVAAVINGGLEAPAAAATPSAGVTGSAQANIQSAGGGDPHNNMPPYMSLIPGIVAR